MKILYRPHEYSQQRQNDKPVHIYPVHMAMEATWHKQQGHEVYWDRTPLTAVDRVFTAPEGLPFLDLPAPDRIATRAFDQKYQRYGNYKYHPATHMMAALDCWYAKCTFCEWAKKYPEVQTRYLGKVLNEVRQCIKLGFKEIFDDSGTFPDGGWLYHFCQNMIPEKITIGCNMRIDPNIDFDLMKSAHFRMILFGVESMNQSTLDRLNKGIRTEDIVPCLQRAAKAGLEPHVAIMTGYPWETLEDEMRTINAVKMMLRNGYAKTAQASVYTIPFMFPTDKGLKNKIYDAAYSPKFWINKLRDLKNWEDFVYLMKSIRKGIIRD